ncbi:MAG: LPS-assembly protein LptD [Hyphomicrobium sp.]
MKDVERHALALPLAAFGRACASARVRASRTLGLAQLGSVLARRALASLLGPALCIGATLSVAVAQDDSSFAVPKPPTVFNSAPKLDKTQPLYLQGDQLIYDSKGSRVIAKGNVEIYYNNNVLRADEVIYDQSANTLSAIGNVELREAGGNIIRAERYDITDDFRDGFVQSLSVVTKDDDRISAERGTRREGNVTEFFGAKYTPCKSAPGEAPVWCISARKVIHDQANATISYQDAQFEILGVPIFYLPYFQHADPSVKRKSGFLLPTYGNSDDLGSFFEVPYYFALAPNYDLTFRPMYLSKQGVLYQADWRHRLADGQYFVKVAGIDQDGDELPGDTINREDLDGFRGTLESKGEFSVASWWKLGWDATIESDDTFRRFYKFDNVLLTDRENKVYLEGISDRNYLGIKAYHFGGLLVNDTAESESRVHPIVDHNYIFEQPLFGGELSWKSNALSFKRTEVSGLTPLDDRTRDQDVNRVVTELKWRRRLTDQIGITYTPFAELRGDLYQLNNYVDPETGALVEDDTVARGLATGGVTVSYPWVANTASASHIIEPIGQIVTRQNSLPQRELPNEDAKSLVFDDTSLFDTNKFSGLDRIETGTRANVGVQYTFQANSGGFVRVLAGQSFHLKGDNAFRNPGIDGDGENVFNPRSGLETDESDYVAGLYFAPNDVFRFVSQSRFDDEDLELRREDLSAAFVYGPISAQATYTYIAADPEAGFEKEEQDIVGTLGLRLTERWTLFGSMRYDLDEGKRLTDSIQLRYGDECFAISAIYQESLIDDPLRDVDPDRSLMFRVELKNLGSYGYKTDVLDHVFGDDQSPRSVAP